MLTVAALTLREASRRRVLLALAVLTVVLLALSGWGFSRLAAESGGTLTSGEARLTASIVLNLVMFGFSLVAALGTAFLAGPTLAGETESGIALAVLARPVRRSAFLLGKWLGPGGLRQRLRRARRAGPDPRRPGDRRLLAAAPAAALALLAAQTMVLLTLAVLLSTAISPMASGVVAVGLFCTTWVAGVVGGVGDVARQRRRSSGSARSRGCCCRPTGCGAGRCTPSRTRRRWRRSATTGGEAFPFLSAAPLTPAYLVWAACGWRWSGAGGDVLRPQGPVSRALRRLSPPAAGWRARRRPGRPGR